MRGATPRFYHNWTTFTGILAQGASTNIAKTKLYDQWRLDAVTGEIVWQFRYQATAAGTAGSQVTVQGPVDMPAALTTGWQVGHGLITHAATTFNGPGVIYLAGAAGNPILVRWFMSTVAGAFGAFGVNPNVAVASGDTFSGEVRLPIV